MAGGSLIKSIGNIIGSRNPLPGAPGRANIPEQGETIIGQNPAIMRSAEEYAERSGIPLRNPTEYKKIDRAFSEMAADYYDRMPHNPNDYRTKQAYDALGKETEAQFEQMLRDGVKPYLFSDKDPYPNSPYQALQDIYENQRLGVFSTRAGFGSDADFDPSGNPLLQEMDYEIDGQPIFLNDAFRAVHDYYGHGKHGFGFRAGGEENAFQAHSGMFSDLARQAAASETRGQNSWLNYGPYGDTNRTARLEDTVFADQKTGLLPNLISTGRTPIADERRRRIDADGVSGLRGKLEGAINPDGIVEAVHYGNRQFDYLDPSQYGKGLSGRTTAERNMAATPEFYDRTFAGLNTTERPYRKEQGLGSVENIVQLPVEQVYDILADPDNIKGAVGNGLDPYSRYTALTKKIYDAGYSAVFQDHPEMGKILSIIDPLKTGKILAAVPVAALGTKAAIGAGLTMAALSPQDSQAGVRKAGETLFDLSRLDEVPDVPQVPQESLRRDFDPNPKKKPEFDTSLDSYGAIPNIYDYARDPDYFRANKDIDFEIVEMSPDEYVSEAARILAADSRNSEADQIIAQRSADTERIKWIQDKMEAGEPFQIGYLDYKSGGQEGFHRALAAKNLGMETIPVARIRSVKANNRIPLAPSAAAGLTAQNKTDSRNILASPVATTLGAGYLGAQAVPGFNEKASAIGEVAAAGLTSLAAPFLTGPTSFLESMNPAIPVDELERRRAARQDRVTSKIESPLAQAYAEQAQQAVAPILQDINQNPYLNALPFDELYEYGSKAVKELPARLRFMGGALLDSTGL